jgi:hypothetical protein
VKGFGARGQPRSYRLPIWCDMAITEIAYDMGMNQSTVLAMLVCEALKARGYTRSGKQELEALATPRPPVGG